MKKTLLIVTLSLWGIQSRAQDSHLFAGYIYDEQTGAAIAGASIKKSNSVVSQK